MRRNPVLALSAICVAAVIALSGCAAESAPSGDENGDGMRIAFLPIDLKAQFFIDLADGLETAAEDLGVEVKTFNPDGSATEQADAMDAAVADGYDAIIVDPVDSVAIIPSVQAAAAAGITVIAADAAVDDPSLTSYVGTNNEVSAKAIGAFLADKITGKAKIGVVTAVESQIQLVRLDGFTSAFEGADVEIIDAVDGGYTVDKSLTACETLLQANPDLDYIYNTGSASVEGCLSAIGDGDGPQIVGWDTTDIILDGIRAGKVLAVVEQVPYDFGKVALETAVKAIKGEKVDATVDIDVKIVTAENVDD